MIKSGIKSGTALNIRLESKMADSAYILKAVFEKQIEDNVFLISQPTDDGKAVLIDSNDKIYVSYAIEGCRYELDGYVEGKVQKGLKTFLKIRKTTDLRRFDQRKYTRIKVEIRVSIEDNKGNTEQALTMDISEGGVVLLFNENRFVGETFILKFPKIKGSSDVEVKSEICWVAQAARSKGQKDFFKHIAGFKFICEDKKNSDAVLEYVKAVFDIMDS